MKTDIAKVSFDELNHFVGVFHQMGRLPLESDLNEQNELLLRLMQRVAGDAVHTGSPNDGFRIGTRVMLDRFESRHGWTPTPTTATVFVDYFDHRVGDGSLVCIGGTALGRTLDSPIDLSQATEVMIGLKAVGAPGVFYVKDVASTHPFTMTELYTDDGWRVFSATPGAWPVGFDPSNVVEYGFNGLSAATRYSFDLLQADVPLRTLLVRTDLASAYSAQPASASLAVDDDDRLWRETSLRATGATDVTYTLPAPYDCSRARKLLVTLQRNPVAVPFTITLVDDATPAATINLAGATVGNVGPWEVHAFALPQAGVFNWSAVTAIQYGGLSTAATYTFGPVSLEADPALDLVIMGGDGTAAGAGRFYADGLAAVKESHGTYFTQVDLPQADPAALVPVADGRRRIDWAYLDLWERPLTYVERPDMREVALEGDTCTRTQLVAQVRLLMGEDVPFANPAESPSAAFDALPRIGTGVLSTKDTPAAQLDPCADPCEPSIAGPYLGEDNRLFRVEIHSAGDLGAAGLPTTATFKWSRNNAAPMSALIADANIGDFSVQVQKPELFAVGDLIEISDDLIELVTGVYEDRVNHTQHTRGELRHIVTVNLQTGRLSWEDPTIVDPAEVPFHAALPNAMRTPFHAKVTQWDEVAAATPGDIVLADGVVIEFGGVNMVAGDYWQFTTRTADRSVERLIEAPPRGTVHAYHLLAAIQREKENAGSPEIVFVQDLRPRFASLPSLDASRVAYDPGACVQENHVAGWEDVTTVQQAIDALCAADLTGDLKLHNKLLHGMGVICGLKLRCSSNRRQIILGKGYALDCEGNLLHQAGDEAIALVEDAQAMGLLNASGNGKVNLWIEEDASGPVVQIEPNVPQNFWDSVLEGTLIKDFWDDCVLTLFNFFKAQLTPFPDATLPLSDQHKLVLSLINLIWQKINAASGPFIFVSKAEHDLLETFHDALQALLASKTYCAMFDSLQIFPPYPYTVPPGIDTMFGMFLAHRRMKRVPGDAYVVTYGIGNQIQFFDIAARSAVAAPTFPGPVNLNARDVAFNSAGTEMYVVGTVIQGTNVDSIFATATITPPAAAGSPPTITWGPATVVCDIEFTSLATHAAQPNRLFGIGRSATDPAKRGMYRFTLPIIPLAPVPVVNFNATGLFAIDTNGIDAVATEHNGGLQTGDFNILRRINLNTFVTSTPFAAIIGRNEFDDLVVANGNVFLTGQSAGQSALIRYTLAPQATLPVTILGALSVWRLALLPTRNFLAIADANTYRIRLFQTSTATLVTNVRVPVQIMPTALAVRSDEGQVYALNMLSNTVNVIDIGNLLLATPSFIAEPPVTLANYRADMLESFTDLLGTLVQYFKDCFCDKFLIECPECTEKDKIYLGTVEIQNSKVFNICNFSKRHYSKSFRTYGYWLSAVPILPIIKKAIAKACCTTLIP